MYYQLIITYPKPEDSRSPETIEIIKIGKDIAKQYVSKIKDRFYIFVQVCVMCITHILKRWHIAKRRFLFKMSSSEPMLT